MFTSANIPYFARCVPLNRDGVNYSPILRIWLWIKYEGVLMLSVSLAFAIDDSGNYVISKQAEVVEQYAL